MKVALLFPGYPSQFVGMGKELYDESRIVQEYFEEASACLNENFVKLIFASSENELAEMGKAYPALFLVGCSIAAALKEEGINPSIVAGYNSGEYAALWAAGGITFPDGLYLLSKFAQVYTDLVLATQVKMIEVIGIEHQELQSLCIEATQGEDLVSIAVYESLHRAYVSGTRTAVERLIALVEKIAGTKIKSAPLEIGLHSALMQSVLKEFQRSLEKVDFKDLRIPLVTNVKAEGIKGGQTAKAALMESIEHAVLWDDMMAVLADADIIIQVGPGAHLAALMKEYYPAKPTFAINTPSDIKILKKFMSSLIVNPGEGDDELHSS